MKNISSYKLGTYTTVLNFLKELNLQKSTSSKCNESETPCCLRISVLTHTF